MEKQPGEKDRGFFIKIIKTLSLPRNSDGIICLGKIADMKVRKIYILGKDPAVAKIVAGILRESSDVPGDRDAASVVGKDRRYYIDISGISEQEEQKIEEIIQSGLIELRSLYFARKRKTVFRMIPSCPAPVASCR
jgi:hypothetical protein